MDLPLLCENYDVVIIDTQGAVGPLQDAAAYAADLLISPIKPDVLSAREFLNGTQQMLSRLALGSRIGLQIPSMKAVIYAMDRTRDAREITTEIRQAFCSSMAKSVCWKVFCAGSQGLQGSRDPAFAGALS